jgi:hypothetical protein
MPPDANSWLTGIRGPQQVGLALAIGSDECRNPAKRQVDRLVRPEIGQLQVVDEHVAPQRLACSSLAASTVAISSLPQLLATTRKRPAPHVSPQVVANEARDTRSARHLWPSAEERADSPAAGLGDCSPPACQASGGENSDEEDTA